MAIFIINTLGNSGLGSRSRESEVFGRSRSRINLWLESGVGVGILSGQESRVGVGILSGRSRESESETCVVGVGV